MGPVKLQSKMETIKEISGWSYRQIADRARVNASTFTDAIRNGSKYAVQDAIKVARALGVKVEWLFNDRVGWRDIDEAPYWWPPELQLPDAKNKIKAVSTQAAADKSLEEAVAQRKKNRRPRNTGGEDSGRRTA